MTLRPLSLWDVMGAGLRPEEKEGSADTSTEGHSRGSSWPKSTVILEEELRC